MKVTLLVNGREMTFSEDELVQIVEEHLEKRKELKGNVDTKIEGKWFQVDLTQIKRELFQQARRDEKQEETRLLIQEALEKADQDSQYAMFEIKIQEKYWKTKSYREMRDIAYKQGAHIADWVEIALWWAQRIKKEEDWSKLCNEIENSKWYKIVVWHNTLAYVGNCTMEHGNSSETEVFECSQLHRIQICDAVPVIVRKK